MSGNIWDDLDFSQQFGWIPYATCTEESRDSNRILLIKDVRKESLSRTPWIMFSLLCLLWNHCSIMTLGYFFFFKFCRARKLWSQWLRLWHGFGARWVGLSISSWQQCYSNSNNLSLQTGWAEKHRRAPDYPGADGLQQQKAPVGFTPVCQGKFPSTDICVDRVVKLDSWRWNNNNKKKIQFHLSSVASDLSTLILVLSVIACIRYYVKAICVWCINEARY